MEKIKKKWHFCLKASYAWASIVLHCLCEIIIQNWIRFNSSGNFKRVSFYCSSSLRANEGWKTVRSVSKVGQNDQFEASFSVKAWHKASLNITHSKPLRRALWRRKNSYSKIFPHTFSNSLIIYQVKTKEITTVKEVWIPGLNSHKFLRFLLLRLLLGFLFRLRRYIKHSRQCFIGYPNTSNFVKNTPLRVVFSTLFSVFGYHDETLSLVFDILHIFPEMDQIQEKKTTKSTIRNISKNSSFIPSLSHLQKPYDNHYETSLRTGSRWR